MPHRIALAQHACFDLGSLAHVSNGYTAGAIANAVNSTLTGRRVQQIQESKKPVDTTEFLSALSKATCVYDDQYRAFVAFTEEVSGEAKRRRAIAKAAAGDGGDDGDKKKKKGDKKGGGKKKKK